MFNEISQNLRLALTTIIFALASGLISVSFMLMVNFIFARTILSFSQHSMIYFLLSSLAAVLVTSLLSGLLVNFFSPSAAGSGIPQVKVAYWQELGRIDLKTGIVKY